MSDWSSRFQVARWEFKRFVKPNQLVVSFVIMMLMGLVGYGVSRWAQRSGARPVNVAVIGASNLRIDPGGSVENVRLEPGTLADMDSLRARLVARSLGGILVIESRDSARLIVRRNPVWRRSIEAHLSSARQRLSLAEAGLAPQELSQLLAPVGLRTEFQAGNDGRAARIAALLSVGVVLYGLFTSMVYLMVSVTAEKQLRVTEQVISAITPQTWIDGKILGISAVAFVNVLLFLLGIAVWILGRSIATGAPFSLGSIEPSALLWIILFALLGFLFWLSVFGAVAAMIDDPNTSTRGPLMFLPAMFSVPGFLVVSNPDSAFARITGLIPLSSAAVMPARVALTEVPLWEKLLAIALLVAGAFIARRVAGKVFSIAMLMYGKEPSWGEMRRWIRES